MSHTASHLASHPAPARHAVDPRLLWFGLFGAPVVWTLQELVGYGLASHACFPEAVPRQVSAVAGLRLWELGIGIAALMIALWAGWTALQSWRAARPDQPNAAARHLEVGEGRARFMAFAGMLLSGIFLLNILMNVLPIFLVSPCG